MKFFTLDKQNKDKIVLLEKHCFPGEAWNFSQIEAHFSAGSGMVDANWQSYILFMENAEELEIFRVGVLPDSRRSGLGSSLVRHLLEYSGTKNVLLEVKSNNTAAIRMYEAIGFVKQGVRKKYYSGGEDALLYIFRH